MDDHIRYHGEVQVGMAVFFFQAEDGIRDKLVTGVQTCALPICPCRRTAAPRRWSECRYWGKCLGLSPIAPARRQTTRRPPPQRRSRGDVKRIRQESLAQLHDTATDQRGAVANRCALMAAPNAVVKGMNASLHHLHQSSVASDCPPLASSRSGASLPAPHAPSHCCPPWRVELK